MQEIDRTRRVSELIRRELSTLIIREISDGRIRNVSINGVTVSRDLKYATIFFSSLDGNTPSSQESKTMEGKSNKRPPPSIEKVLNNAAGYLRRLLSQNVQLRITPTLVFKYDDSIQRGVEMSSLIESLNKKHGSK